MTGTSNNTFLVSHHAVEVLGVSQVEKERRKRTRRRHRGRGNRQNSPNTTDASQQSFHNNNNNDDDDVDDATFDTASSSSSSSSLSSSVKNKISQQHQKCKLKLSRPPRLQQARDLPLHEQQQYVAMDCEMVGVGYRGRKSAVARVTLVGWNGEILLDEFVRPTEEVTDYRTFVSGVTARDLDQKARWTLSDCQRQVRKLLEDKILVGHALKNDLRALGIRHPWQQTRDTGKYEPLMKKRTPTGLRKGSSGCSDKDNVLWPRKLRDLAHDKLGREIQVPGRPRSAYEDALAAMDLYKKLRHKWEKAVQYKILRTKEIEDLAAALQDQL